MCEERGEGFERAEVGGDERVVGLEEDAQEGAGVAAAVFGLHLSLRVAGDEDVGATQQLLCTRKGRVQRRERRGESWRGMG